MKSTMVLAKDIIKSIIEGDIAMMNWLQDQTKEYKLVLLKSCLIEGLENANPATSSGLRKLATLIAISRFQDLAMVKEPPSEEATGNEVQLTADVLLSCLCDLIDNAKIHAIANTFPVVISDAALVAALLSVEDEDELHANNLAAVLRVIKFSLVDIEDDARAQWPEQFSSNAISDLRIKSRVKLRD